ncbi:MAG: Mur ligase domain-containing protein, partial [Candidatus Acidiferrales bacterium]
MKLEKLLAGAEIRKISGPSDVEIESIAYDSRRAGPGALFFAMHGMKLEGVEFVEDALVRGAVAVASARERPIQFPENATWIELAAASERRGLARAAAN